MSSAESQRDLSEIKVMVGKCHKPNMVTYTTLLHGLYQLHCPTRPIFTPKPRCFCFSLLLKPSLRRRLACGFRLSLSHALSLSPLSNSVQQTNTCL
ncbi:hypothetical protein L6452_13378 [Arctium lappa]|uniref:Uncharacterized protein n=1 Tax=Arctium lappa TaxID=4217 RepID=A0ACB9CI49_ARCLA|nr:hypothetical protein L6452_13378 [Arctium lappa]